jgi:hypothetical protein
VKSWLLLAATLPATPSALRVRVWRALKATGAGMLRDGVYVLPASAPSAASLRDLEQTIAEAGADAHLLDVDARDAAQEAAFRQLFDRTEAWTELTAAIRSANAALRQTGDADLPKVLRPLDQQAAAIHAIDFFPGDTAAKAQAALDALHRAVAARLAPDEPNPDARALEALDVEDFQGRTWATRRRPWIDRLGTAWLVKRFIDRDPRFTWLADSRKCPKSALGYDFDGARFTHVGELVTFEVVARSFDLDADPAIARLAALVHYVDVGGMPVDEAPGLERIVRGLQSLHADDDDALLEAALPIFDALHAAFGASR